MPDPTPLHQELRRLWKRAGQPGSREVAKRTRGGISHTTVRDLLNAKRIGTWHAVEALALALDGDRQRVYDLWSNEKYEDDEPVEPPPPVPSRWTYQTAFCDIWEIHHLCNHMAQHGWEPLNVFEADDQIELPEKVGVESGPLRKSKPIKAMGVLFRQRLRREET